MHVVCHEDALSLGRAGRLYDPVLVDTGLRHRPV